MLADAHREAALDYEDTIARMANPVDWPRANRSLIGDYWGAAFHWIAYACQQKHSRHKENHSGLVSYLRSLGEHEAASHCENLENVRNGGVYGHQNAPADVQEAPASGRRFVRGR